MSLTHFLTALCLAHHDISLKRASSLTCALQVSLAFFIAVLSASDIGAAAAGAVTDTAPPMSARAIIAADDALTNLDISFCSFWKITTSSYC
jgi:hypothetical protein